MFMYNDAYVTYEQRVNHEYQDIYADAYSPPYQMLGSASIVHILNVRSLDVEVTVTAETGYGFSQAVVMSCLAAAVKNIDDGYLYTLVRKRIENQMGFELDDFIPAGVANPTDVDYSMDGTHWHFNVIASLNHKYVRRPKFELIKNEHQFGMVETRLNYYSGVHPGHISILIEEGVIAESDWNSVEHAQMMLWYKAYEEMPMLAPDLSYMRYTEGLLNGSKYHTSGYYVDAPNKAPNFSGPLAKPAVSGYGKDSRVNELPGVKEMVTHPLSKQKMTLERAIISLNDQHKWTREQIADWLETLDIDITFKVNTDEQD